ncbi:DUF5961 family protein [Caulobacter segnis]
MRLPDVFFVDQVTLQRLRRRPDRDLRQAGIQPDLNPIRARRVLASTPGDPPAALHRPRPPPARPSRPRRRRAQAPEAAALATILEDFAHDPEDDEPVALVIVRDQDTGREQCFRVDLATGGEATPCG